MNRRLCIHSLYKSITYRGKTVFWLRELDTNAGCPTGHSSRGILDLILIFFLIKLLKHWLVPLSARDSQKCHCTALPLPLPLM